MRSLEERVKVLEEYVARVLPAEQCPACHSYDVEENENWNLFEPQKLPRQCRKCSHTYEDPYNDLRSSG